MSNLDYRDPEWVAECLGLEKNTVYKYLKDGTLPAVQIGRKWLVSETHLAGYLQQEVEHQTRLRRIFASKADLGQQVMDLARAEAQRYGHNYLGQEHMVLALCGVDSLAREVMLRLGADFANIRQIFKEHLVSEKRVEATNLPLTPRVQEALDLAVAEAQNDSFESFKPQHLLIALLQSKEGWGFKLLAYQGLELNTVRAEIIALESKKTNAGSK